MCQPILEIRRQPFRGRRFKHWVGDQRQHFDPAQGIGVFFNAPPHGVFRQSRRPRFVEPLLERPALIRPAVMIIRGRHVRTNSYQVRRFRDRRQELRGPHVRSAKHPHLPIGIGKSRRPFHGVISVLRLMPEGVPFAFRLKPPAHVLCHHHIAPRRPPMAKAADPLLVVWHAHQQDGVFSIRLRPVNIGAQRHAIAHLRGHVALHRHLVVFRGHHGWPQQPQSQRESGKKQLQAFLPILLHEHASFLIYSERFATSAGA